MGQRRRAREFALQMLFQIDLTGNAPRDVFPLFWSTREVEDDLREFAQALVLGVMSHREQLDEVIGGSADHWRLERMATVDRNVLRLAVYEMLSEPQTPHPVVIDEAIEVAKKFGSEDSGSFINGILDAVRGRIERGKLDLSPDS